MQSDDDDAWPLPSFGGELSGRSGRRGWSDTALVSHVCRWAVPWGLDEVVEPLQSTTLHGPSSIPATFGHNVKDTFLKMFQISCAISEFNYSSI